MIQQDKRVHIRTSTDHKTNIKDLKKWPVWYHFQKIKLGTGPSHVSGGAHSKKYEFMMTTWASSDSEFGQEKYHKKGGTQCVEFLSKEEVEKRLKAWERTTLARKRNK